MKSKDTLYNGNKTDTAAFQAEQTRILFSQLPMNLLALLITATIMFFVLKETISIQTLFIWYACILLQVLFRAASFLLYQKRVQQDNQRKWTILFIWGALIGGVIFGSAGIFLFPADNILYRVFIYFVMAGMSAGACGTYAINMRAFFAYSVPVFFPATIHFFVLGGKDNITLGAVGLVFFLMIGITVLRINKVSIDFLRLTFRNEELYTSLDEEKERTETYKMKLDEMSLKDPMTGLKNRRFFLEVIKPEAAEYSDRFGFAADGNSERRESRDSIYGIFLVDIDHFKRVNDSFGHDSGDLLLQQFSNILTRMVRANDLVIRWGGEEFLVILRNTTRDYLPTFAEVMRQKIESTIFTMASGGTMTRTCSVGFVSYPFDPHQPGAFSLEQSITLADRLLEYAKNHGRNMSVGASPVEGVFLDEDQAGVIIDSFDRAVFDDIIKIDLWGQ